MSYFIHNLTYSYAFRLYLFKNVININDRLQDMIFVYN